MMRVYAHGWEPAQRYLARVPSIVQTVQRTGRAVNIADVKEEPGWEPALDIVPEEGVEELALMCVRGADGPVVQCGGRQDGACWSRQDAEDAEGLLGAVNSLLGVKQKKAVSEGVGSGQWAVGNE